MKKYIFFLLVNIFTLGYLYAQPNFNQTINLNTEFTNNTTITPFSGGQFTSIGISGSILLNSDTSFVRVIVNDGAGNEYLIYEMYKMLTSENSFDFNYECEESCFYDNFTPVNMVIQIKDATLNINHINLSNTTYNNAASQSADAKSNKNLQKLTSIQNYIQVNDLIWVAEETELSKLSYHKKAEIWGAEYVSLGFEFYANGIYSITGPKGNATTNYDYVGNFDWRNRHNANISTSPYYDGDPNGTGWMTPVVCQGMGCWLNGTFHCNVSEQDCNSMGGSYRTAGTCWIFGPTAYIEALTNLYYNEHIDVDLSEQYIACKENTVNAWIVSKAFNYYKGSGVPDENCLPYSASLDNCSNECTNPYEKIKIADYTEVHGAIYGSNLTHHDVRQYVMDYGPVEANCMYMPWGVQTHSMSLVGWGVIDEDELSMIGITNPISHDWYGCTYWIYKENLGSGQYHNGFKYMIHYNGQQPNITTATLPITSLNRTDADIKCYDKDGDGYYYWGIGPKPAHCPPCPDEKDGDDSNPGLGPLNDDGTCTIINTYNASFEKDWDNWIQVGTDDQDWWRHTGPTETHTLQNGITGPSSAQDGNYYIYTEGSCNGCYPQKEFIIVSPLIDLKDYCQAQIDFYYNQHTYLWGNPDDAKLTLQVSYDEGATWTNLWYVLHDQGSQWHNEKIALPIGVNKVRFIAKSTYNEFSDIALDNITIGPLELEATPITINSANTIWNADATINANVIIENNADLTITNNCTISINEFAKIIVKPGGKLIIDNATITTKCEKAYWKGIEVWGNDNLPQIPISNQGFVEVKNNGTIKNADVAIRTMKVNTDGSWDWSSNGGIVRINGAKFINNNNSIWIGSYHSPNRSVNISYIRNSEFELNIDMNEGHIGYSFIGLLDIDRISISGNSFVNLQTGLNENERSRGIVAYDAAFSVNAICNDANQTYPPSPCVGLDKNYFEGLYYGVYASNNNASSSSVVIIDQADFVNVYHGVHLINTKNAAIIRSSFEIPASSDLLSVTYPYGIMLNGSDAYRVEENTFTKYDDACYDVRGIVVSNSGGDDNEIYKNSFNDLKISIEAQYDNRNTNGGGLKLICNDMYSQQYDIAVRDEGIAQNQQISNIGGTPPYIPVGNQFTYCTQSTSNWHETNIKNGGGNINYLYKNGDKPNCVTYYHTTPPSLLTHVHDVETNQGFYGSVTECPSKINIGGDDISELLTAYSVAKIALNSSIVIYNIWKDGGNANLEDEVETTQPWDIYVQFNELLAESPDLSEEVILAAIENSAFSSLMIKLIMVANPHANSNDVIMEAIYNRIPALPESYIEDINAGSSTTTQLEVLAANVSSDRHLVNTTADNIKRIYRSDYDNANAINSLITFVSAENTLESQYELVSLYLETDQFSSMNTVLSNISANYSLDDQQMTDLANWQIYFGIAQSVKESGEQYGVLSETQIASIETLANLNRPLISSAAIALLLSDNNNYPYHEEVLPIDESSARMAHPSYSIPTDENESENALKVYPNPSHDYITLEYSINGLYSNIWFEIVDARGRTVLKQNLKVGSSEELVCITNLMPGVYTLILYTDVERIAVEKITVVK